MSKNVFPAILSWNHQFPVRSPIFATGSALNLDHESNLVVDNVNETKI